MSEPIINISHVRKRYKNVEALRGISLQVNEGQIFGFLGPNGAGKSTLVKILTSIVKPTECEGTLLGRPIGHKPTLKKVGYLPEHARFPEYLKGKEVIQYVAGLSGMSRSNAKKKSTELLELVGMSEWANHKLSTYSKGMKQRIGIAQSLVNDPELVFLDEPTDGVDPKGRIEMRKMLIDMREQGRTVFVNSHLLAELQLICDSVAIMDKGEIQTQGTIAELTAKSQRYEIEIKGTPSAGLIDKFKSDKIEVNDQKVLLYQSDVDSVQPVIDALRSESIQIVQLQEVHQNLEELFLSSIQSTTVGGTQA